MMHTTKTWSTTIVFYACHNHTVMHDHIKELVLTPWSYPQYIFNSYHLSAYNTYSSRITLEGSSGESIYSVNWNLHCYIGPQQCKKIQYQCKKMRILVFWTLIWKYFFPLLSFSFTLGGLTCFVGQRQITKSIFHKFSNYHNFI